MKVVVAENTGFCYGVKRAIDLVDKRLKEKKRLYSLGPFIHNHIVIKELEKRGLKIVDSLFRIKAGEFLVIRSHGLHPVLIEEAKRRRVKIIDATCPFLKMVQKKVRYLIAKGYEVIIIGDPNHPEVRALAGFARDEAIIIDEIENLKRRSRCETKAKQSDEVVARHEVPWQSHEVRDCHPCFRRGRLADAPRNDIKNQISKIRAKKVGVVSQTTINGKDYQRTVTALYKKIEPEEFLVFNTICQITEKRQGEVATLSRRINSFLVLGSKESSNTRTLYEMCRKRRPSFLIEIPSQIKKEWFMGVGTVGILSGTSTPDWVVKETTDALARVN